VSAVALDRLPAVGPAVITLGVFDGVHRGHRAVLAGTVAAARHLEAAAIAIVFSPHPDEVLRPGTVVPRLLPPDVSLDRVRSLGVRPVEVCFDDALRSLEPEAFLDALAPAIELRGVAMTPGSAFGRRRSGTLERVRDIGRQRGFETVAIEPAMEDGEAVSSSRIRDVLAAGDVASATQLLTAPPILRGVVVHGDARGRLLGYPTANLAFRDYTPALPALGIYLGHVSVPERDVGPRHPALVSVGVRPTFGDHGAVLVEAYLLDWDGDLYDAALELELTARLREERRFPTADALVEQMHRDEAEARRLVSDLAG
jgi:riboflavin kinase / FMN adenylyltransferase